MHYIFIFEELFCSTYFSNYSFFRMGQKKVSGRRSWSYTTV